MSARAGMSLHKGLGVRAPDLVDIRTTDLARRLFINHDDEPLVVLAKVLWQVEHAIRQVTNDLQRQEVLRYGYNLPRDAALNGLKVQKRLLRLAERKNEPGWKLNTTNKYLPELVERVVNYWYSRPVPALAEEVEELVRLETEYARGGNSDVTIVASVDVDRLMRDTSGGESRTFEALFPQLDLYFEIDAAGYAGTARTADLGEYLCVFTRPELLDEYLALVGGASGGSRPVKKGREVLAVLREHRDVGLAVNPVVGGGAWHHWKPAEVADRWPGRRLEQEG